MTKISRSIDVHVDPGTLWQYMDMRKWSEISSIFTKVDLSSTEMKVGGEANIIAGPGDEKVNYIAKITACEPGQKLEYFRTGGPLPGKSEWSIAANHSGSEIRFMNTFDDPLPEPVKHSMIATMDRFLGDLKIAVENGANGKK
jgi:hypothetical protein